MDELSLTIEEVTLSTWKVFEPVDEQPMYKNIRGGSLVYLESVSEPIDELAMAMSGIASERGRSGK